MILILLKDFLIFSNHFSNSDSLDLSMFVRIGKKNSWVEWFWISCNDNDRLPISIVSLLPIFSKKRDFKRFQKRFIRLLSIISEIDEIFRDGTLVIFSILWLGCIGGKTFTHIVKNLLLDTYFGLGLTMDLTWQRVLVLIKGEILSMLLSGSTWMLKRLVSNAE